MSETVIDIGFAVLAVIGAVVHAVVVLSGG